VAYASRGDAAVFKNYRGGAEGTPEDIWLGNNFHEHKGHGHLHLVPRYQNSREFSGMTFTDENWGRNCFPHTDLFPPKEILVGIRDALREELQP